MSTFIVYEAATGRIIATDRTEEQALNLATALRVYGGFNVSVQETHDVEGDSVHTVRVRLDEV